MNNDSKLELACPELLRRTATGWTLLGNRCDSCGEYYFPARAGCARCCGTALTPCDIGDRGILWSWTIQGFLPKSPYNSGESESTFKPFGVGYVQMSSGLKVESRLTVADPERLKIGAVMELVLEPYRTRAEGGDVATFAFRPVA
jgi:uncharacterized OB-fold protein